ncbi:hypothetical protein BK658_24590 [Pseudomonas brassicacearum]|uniref:Uncharacterized protein n=1 Tax=Pseudomonas brassicacearum TaxID=930166 RepID=A0A423GKP3_9PSED|nr:hypothetical protein BK658_24590 [Pseudomonas brassicacearum]
MPAEFGEGTVRLAQLSVLVVQKWYALNFQWHLSLYLLGGAGKSVQSIIGVMETWRESGWAVVGAAEWDMGI